MNIFTRIASAASESDLNFLIVGGHAVNAHGYQRTTLDAIIEKYASHETQAELQRHFS